MANSEGDHDFAGRHIAASLCDAATNAIAGTVCETWMLSAATAAGWLVVLRDVGSRRVADLAHKVIEEVLFGSLKLLQGALSLDVKSLEACKVGHRRAARRHIGQPGIHLYPDCVELPVDVCARRDVAHKGRVRFHAMPGCRKRVARSGSPSEKPDVTFCYHEPLMTERIPLHLSFATGILDRLA